MTENECINNEKCNCNCNNEYRDPNCKCGDECHCNDKKHNKKEQKNKEKIEIENLKKEIENLKQASLLSKAELVNYRKRKDEELTRMLKFCNEDLIKQILPILDNFERAIKLDDNNLDDEVSKFLEGFKMIYCNMQNVMNNFEVKAIDEVKAEFNPNYHNAIMVEHVDGIEPGMVIEILQKGYIYKDKVIRPAMVKVSE